ncbi:hypothetical protein KA005_54295 [bacterium]|nr:hypothetical protein [bacterium]
MIHFEEFFISIDTPGIPITEVKKILEDGCVSEGYDYVEIDVADGTNADFAFSAVKQEE